MQPLEFWHWWVIAAVLAAIEIAAPGAFLLWLGIAAAAVGLVTILLPGIGWQFQLLCFAGTSIAAVLLGRRFYRREIKTDAPTLNRRGEQLIGRVMTLSEPIVDGLGRIRVGDGAWSVEGEDMKAGTRVRVVGIDGTRLRVERVV